MDEVCGLCFVPLPPNRARILKQFSSKQIKPNQPNQNPLHLLLVSREVLSVILICQQERDMTNVEITFFSSSSNNPKPPVQTHLSTQTFCWPRPEVFATTRNRKQNKPGREARTSKIHTTCRALSQIPTPPCCSLCLSRWLAVCRSSPV